MQMAQGQLEQYLDKYKNRLKASNVRYIKQILVLIQAFLKVLVPLPSDSQSESKESRTWIQTINEFLYESHIDNLNIFKIEKYFKRSEIVKKLNGFVDKVAASQVHLWNRDGDEENHIERHRPALGIVESFLLALTNADADGRIVVKIDSRFY